MYHGVYDFARSFGRRGRAYGPVGVGAVALGLAFGFLAFVYQPGREFPEAFGEVFGKADDVAATLRDGLSALLPAERYRDGVADVVASMLPYQRFGAVGGNSSVSCLHNNRRVVGR
jgi:hypothetical protein